MSALITAAQWNNYLGATGSVQYLYDELYLPYDRLHQKIVFPADMIYSSGFGDGNAGPHGLSFFCLSGDIAGNDHRCGSLVNTGFAGNLIWNNVFDKNPEFECYISLDSVVSVQFTLFLGAYVDGDASAYKYFGIDILANALRSLSSDGTTRSILDQATTISAATWYKIRCRLISGAMQLWVNDVAKTNKTTNLPTGAISPYDFGLIAWIETAAAAHKRSCVAMPWIIWDY